MYIYIYTFEYRSLVIHLRAVHNCLYAHQNLEAETSSHVFNSQDHIKVQGLKIA